MYWYERLVSDSQQSTEAVESLNIVSSLNLEIEFKFNRKYEEKIIKKIFGWSNFSEIAKITYIVLIHMYQGRTGFLAPFYMIMWDSSHGQPHVARGEA